MTIKKTTRKSNKTTTKLKKKKFYGYEDFEKEYGVITFAEVIRSYRECEELTQVELALKLGITPTSLCDLEKGKKIPSLKRAFSIASKLGESTSVWVQVALQDYFRKQKINLKVLIAA